ICENYVQNYVYVSPNQYAKTFGEKCEYRGVYGQISDYDTNFTNELATDLMKNTEFLGISYTTTIVETFTNIFDRLDMVVLVLIFSASLLAFVVLYNLTNININERVREIATIKVLGFYDGEVSRYIYRENIVLTIIGTLTGFVMGIFLHQYVMRVAEVNIVMFGRDILPPSFLWAGLLTILFGLLVNFVMHFRLKRINMVESLKSIE
ncbi:MAG: ABC transporter permease, partial [Oscillospiraceae bacterium]